MRGTTSRQVTMLGVIDPEQLIPANHPIRRIRPLVETALVDLEPTFERMYAEIGRPSIPPEHLLKSCLLMALYSIRSERQFCERLRYDLLFKWFLGLNVEDEPFDHSSFAKNRKRLLEHRVSRQFFEAVVQQARRRHLLSSQHFTVDGTLLESWASMKSLRPRQGDGPGTHPGGGGKNADVDFRGQRRANETHYSTTDPEARMARKGLGKETRLCFTGHVLMENRHGLAVDVELTPATGTSEREAAMSMLQRTQTRRRGCTLGADKGYDTRDFVDRCREMGVAPHIAMRESWWANGHLARLQGTPRLADPRAEAERLGLAQRFALHLHRDPGVALAVGAARADVALSVERSSTVRRAIGGIRDELERGKLSREEAAAQRIVPVVDDFGLHAVPAAPPRQPIEAADIGEV